MEQNHVSPKLATRQYDFLPQVLLNQSITLPSCRLLAVLFGRLARALSPKRLAKLAPRSVKL